MQFSTIVTAAIFGTIAAAAPTYEEALQIRSLVIRQTKGVTISASFNIVSTDITCLAADASKLSAKHLTPCSDEKYAFSLVKKEKNNEYTVYIRHNKFFGHTDVTLAARKATSQDQDLIIYQVGAVPKVEIFLKED